MSSRQFEPWRAVEVLSLKYGSGYRISGGLVLTAAHLLGEKGSDCIVRDKSKQKAQVIWKAQNSDIALIKLPDNIPGIEAIALGKLPKSKTGEQIKFQMYGYPRWGWIQRDEGSAASGLQVEGTIYLANTYPDDILMLRIGENLASEYSPEKTISEWAGMSGAAVICDGLVVAVQTRHPRPMQPNYVEATPLWTVCNDVQYAKWCQLLKEHGINPEPEIARLPAAEKPLEIAWHEVCCEMLIQQKKLTSNLLKAGGDFELKDLYVPLALVEKQPPKKRGEDVSPEWGSPLYREENQKEKIIPIDRFFEEVLQQGISPKSRGQRIALTGEAGSGKTTLLQKIAFWVLDNDFGLPIWVPLSQVKTTLSEYLTKDWLELVTANVTSEIRQDLEKQSNEGRLWLLLDGLDERSNPTEPGFINSLQSGWVRKARMVLSSRLNVWEIAQNALSGFDVYRNLDFAPEQVQQFVRNWFTKAGNTESGERLLQELNKSGKERIKDLVRNPLRCFLLCRNWQRQEGTLPDTKAQFYEKFVNAIYQWKTQDYTTEKAKRKLEDQKQKLNEVLAQLAKDAIDGQEDKGTDPDKLEKARFELHRKFIVKHFKEKEELLDLALKWGWLNQVRLDERDEEVYAFYHPIFQEYFAALAIDDWDFFLPRNHKNKPVPGKQYRVFEPQWREVILLWMGREDVDLEKKNTFIDALIKFEEGCGKFSGLSIDKGFYEYRTYFLASACIAEFCADRLADEIVAQIVRWSFGYFNPEQKKWIEFSAPIRQGAKKALQETKCSKAVKPLEQLLKILKNEDLNLDNRKPFLREIYPLRVHIIRYYVADLLGRKIDPGNQITITSLADLLHLAQFGIFGVHDDICREVIYSLGEIGRANKIAIMALVEFLQSTEHQQFRRSITESLRRIDPDSEVVIDAFVQLLQCPEAERQGILEGALFRDKRTNADRLGEILITNPKAIEALEQMLGTVQDERIRWRVADSLGKIDVGNPQAISTLAQLCESAESENLLSAVASLGKIGKGNEEVIKTLSRFLTQLQSKELTQEEFCFALAAIDSLEKIGVGKETAITALADLLQLTNRTRGKILELWKSGEREFAESLYYHENILYKIIFALEKIGKESSIAINALEKMLQSFERTPWFLQEFRVTSRFLADSLERIRMEHLDENIEDRGTEELTWMLPYGGLIHWITEDIPKWIEEDIEKIAHNDQFVELLTELKEHLINNHEDDKMQDVYEKIWYYIQFKEITYPTFYDDWHLQAPSGSS